MKIAYTANILRVVDSDVHMTLDNSSDDSLYVIYNLTMQYTILSSDAGGSMVLVPRQINSDTPSAPPQYIKDGYNKIKEGQIIDIYKSIYTDETQQPTSQRAFLGFITSIEYRKSSEGVLCVVNFKQLLSQFMMLPVGQTPLEKSNIGLTNVSVISNMAKVSQITNGSIATSLMAIAQGDNLYTNTSNPNVFNVSEYLPESVLIYSDLNTSRDTLLRQAIAPYNMVMFQNEDGTIDIDLLSLSNVNNDWTVLDGEYLSIRMNNAAGVTINTLNQYYMIPAMLETFRTAPQSVDTQTNFVIQPYAGYYPREMDLYNTGNFTYGLLLGKSLDSNVTSNPEDFTYLQNASNTLTVQVDGKIVPIAKLYGLQEYAKILTTAHTSSVVYAMTSEMFARTLPLGQIVNFQLTDDVMYNNQMVCHSATVVWNVQSGCTLLLEFSNLLSITGIWGD